MLRTSHPKPRLFEQGQGAMNLIHDPLYHLSCSLYHCIAYLVHVISCNVYLVHVITCIVYLVHVIPCSCDHLYSLSTISKRGCNLKWYIFHPKRFATPPPPNGTKLTFCEYISNGEVLTQELTPPLDLLFDQITQSYFRVPHFIH